MRPERFSREMNAAFNLWFKTKTVEGFKPLLREMNRVWKKWAKEDNDYRVGAETYGYVEIDSIRSSMFYISDRWYCAFRLKWLIDGIEQGYIK